MTVYSAVLGSFQLSHPTLPSPAISWPENMVWMRVNLNNKEAEIEHVSEKMQSEQGTALNFNTRMDKALNGIKKLFFFF